MQTISNALNKVKDGYLVVVDWAEDHPHIMAWALVASVASRVWF